MDNIAGTFCRLCLDDITDEKFTVIGDVIKEVSAVLLLNLSLDEKHNYVMCHACSAKLIAAFHFKAMCLDTEDGIFPYANSENVSHVDLRDVYLKKQGDQKLITLDQQVCRLCMQLVDEFVSLEELCESNAVEKYVPELNFAITKDAVICKQCSNSLGIHISFLENCACIEEKIKDDYDENPDTSLYIKSEKINIKSEEYEDHLESPLCASTGKRYKSNSIKEEYCRSKYKAESGASPRIYECNNCNFITKWRFSFMHHQLVHKDPSKLRMYKCSECDYETKRKWSLINHQLRHKDPSEVQKHKCDKCDYEALLKCNLTRHKKTHKDPSQLQMYKCDKCDYQTQRKYYIAVHRVSHENVQMHKCNKCSLQFRRKSNLIKHQFKHANPQIYKCDKCKYQTKSRKSFALHQILHKDPSEVKMYKCSECHYETKHRTCYRTHQMIHKDPSEMRMYKCDKCKFQTKYKRSLPYHYRIKHKDSTEAQSGFTENQQGDDNVRMYKCDKCDYRAKWKKAVEAHQKVHKKPSEVEIYKCHNCYFETKYKASLVHHQLKHKDSSELQMYKCDECDFQTKRKHNLAQHQIRHKVGQEDARESKYTDNLGNTPVGITVAQE